MSTYAVIETGSKQYRVEPKSVIEVEKLNVPETKSKQVTIDKVILLKDGSNVVVGAPFVKGAKVVCDHLGDIKSKKVISYRFRRRKDSERKVGHRQILSRLLVKTISSK